MHVMHGHVADRKHYIIVTIVYTLLTVAVLVGTFLLVAVGKGYYYDRETGEVIQNGLVLLESHPVSAQIYLDGAKKRQTPRRMTIESGKHEIKLERSGYRTWQKTFMLEPAEVLWLNYPLMIAEELKSNYLETLPEKPLIKISKDNKYIARAAGSKIEIRETNQPDKPAQFIAPGNENEKVNFLQFSDNSKFILVGVKENTQRYVVIDRSNSSDRKDVTLKLVNLKPVKFLTDSDGKLLAKGNKESQYIISLEGSAPPKLIAERASIISEDNSMFVYKDSKRNILAVRQNDKEEVVVKGENVKSIKAVALSTFEGSTSIAYSDKDNTHIVARYKEEKQETKKMPVAGNEIIASPNGRFILARNKSNFAVYDFDRDMQYRYDLSAKKVGLVTWLGKYQIGAIADGKLFIFDFDGDNVNEIVSARPVLVGVDSNLEFVYTVDRSKVDKKLKLQVSSLTLED